MSLQFNDTQLYRGLVQIFEKECGFERGAIANDNDKLKEYAADANLALDDIFTIGFKAAGSWNLDDTNFTDYPLIRGNIVSGQRDYPFLRDGSGNLILNIHRLLLADATGKFREIYPVDQQKVDLARGVNPQTETSAFINGQNLTGTPSKYDKTGNSIFFDLIPNYNFTNGIELYIDREPSYFLYTDTTKFAGIPGNLHRYLALKPAMDFARRHTLSNYNALALEVEKFEQIIIPQTFGGRQMDIKPRMMPSRESNK